MLFSKKQTACYASEIASFLNLPLVGEDAEVYGVSGINHPESYSLMFFTLKGNTKFNLDNKHSLIFKTVQSKHVLILMKKPVCSLLVPVLFLQIPSWILLRPCISILLSWRRKELVPRLL